MKKKIVIVGGGLAGCLLCNALVGDAEVTLLEAGAKDRFHYPPVKFDRKPLAQVPTFCFGSGGTTNLWHNGLIPIRREDVADPLFAEMLDQLEPFADRAARALHFDAPFSSVYQDLTAEMTALGRALGDFPGGIDCLLYPKQYRALGVDSQVRAVYQVRELAFDCSRGVVNRISCISGGQRYSFEADTLIIAAGALSTPAVLQPLLESAGVPWENLGSGFIDHPMGFVGKVRFGRQLAGVVRKLAMHDWGGFVSRQALRLKSACGRYTCAAFLRPSVTMDNRLAIYKYKSLLGASSGLQRLRHACSWKILHPDILAEIVSHLCNWSLPSPVYNVMFVAEQKRGGNRVHAEPGRLGVDWTISAEELAVYRQLLEDLRQRLQQVAEEVVIQTELSEEWLWSCAHHSGTLSLGSSDCDHLDHNLKLKCLDNVYVCDGSVIQEHSYANTGLTIGQLALRLAERVGHGTA